MFSLTSVSGEPSPTRREAVKKKTAEYLMRAEQISSQYLRSNMGQGSTQTAVSGREVSLALTLCISEYANLLHILVIQRGPESTWSSLLECCGIHYMKTSQQICDEKNCIYSVSKCALVVQSLDQCCFVHIRHCLLCDHSILLGLHVAKGHNTWKHCNEKIADH